MEKNYLFVFLALAVVLSLTTNVNSTSEEDLAFLRNYAVQNYGLDNESIELQYIAVDLPDFRCSDWYGHEICQAGFKDKYDNTVGLYWDKDTGDVYDYKPSFHQIHPEVSPKIDPELYYWIKENSSSDTGDIEIMIWLNEKVTMDFLHQVNETGMFIAPVSYTYVNNTGPGIHPYWVLGRATPLQIEEITGFYWVSKMILNEPIYVTDIVEPNESMVLSPSLIISNSIDKPAAERLKKFLERNGIQSELKEAKSLTSFYFPRKPLILILGGPQAYEGVGEIVSQYFSESEKNYLINKNGSYGYWIKPSDWIDDQRVIIIAGHTRNETALAELVFESRELTDEGLLVV